MAKGSGVGIRITAQDVPVLRECESLPKRASFLEARKTTLLMYRNRSHLLNRWIKLANGFYAMRTSGGLLISVDGEQAEELLHKLKDAGVEASLIGEIISEHPGRIVVL